MKTINEREIIKIAMKERGVTQAKLAEMVGTTQNNLSACINRVRMSVDVFKEAMDMLEYDIIIVDRRTGENAMKVEM